MMREKLDELARLYAAAKLGPMVSVHIISPGYEHCANLCTRLDGHKSEYPVAMMQSEWADVIAATMNAFPAILERLERAETELDELREESAYIKQQLEWVEENGDTYTKESLIEFIRRTIHAISHTPAIKEGIAARDAQQRREGAAEWLEAFARKDAFEKLAYLHDEKLLAEAKRLREGGE